MTQWKDDRHVQHPLTKKILQPETVHNWEEEGNEKPPRKNNFPRKNSEPCVWFMLRSKSSMRRSPLLK